jgi:hypothetical protein
MRTFSFPIKPLLPWVDESQNTLPPVKAGPRNRAKSVQSQKKDIEAINKAFKRKIGDDGYRSQGAFGRKHAP